MSYSKQIVGYFERTTHIGSLPEGSMDVGTGLVGAPACGDVMKLHVRIKDGKILKVRYKTFGCMAAIASSACLAEMIEGMSVAEATKITNEDVACYLDLPIVKLHCSCLVAEVLQAAIKNYTEKQDNQDAKVVQNVVSGATYCVDSAVGCEAGVSCYMNGDTPCGSTVDSDVQVKSVAGVAHKSTTQLFDITKSAADCLIASGARDFVVDVKHHGCAGISYTMHRATDDDRMLECVSMHDVRIFVRPTSSLFLVGVLLDCEGKGLVFHNPHEAKKCKCGAAFMQAS